MIEVIRRMWRDDEGQDLAEYAMLVALIALIVIVAIDPLGTTIASVFTEINSGLTSALAAQ